MPLYCIDAEDGDDLGIYAGQEDPQPGDRLTLNHRSAVVTVRVELPDDHLFDALLSVAVEAA